MAREQLLLSDLVADLHLHSKKGGEKIGEFIGSHDADLDVHDLIRWGSLHAPQIQTLGITDHAERFGPAERFDGKDKDGRPDKYAIEYTFTDPTYLSSQLNHLTDLQNNGRVHVLSGIEVSIQGSGRINAVSSFLKEFDFVIASDHYYNSGGTPQQVTERWITALSNLHVDILGHPGRNYEKWREVDWERIATTAATLDKAIEINMQHVAHFGFNKSKSLEPSRIGEILEILGRHNTKVSLGSDAHRFLPLERNQGWNPRQLVLVRRVLRLMNEAGIRKENVLNTWGKEEIVAWAKKNNHT